MTAAKDANGVIWLKLSPQANDGIVQAAAQADSTAASTAEMVADFNALLAKLRDAGILAQ